MGSATDMLKPAEAAVVARVALRDVNGSGRDEFAPDLRHGGTASRLRRLPARRGICRRPYAPLVLPATQRLGTPSPITPMAKSG